jgi:hypothetical protein
MVKITMININESLAVLLNPLCGEPCISASVGEWKSLTLWFGKEISSQGSLTDCGQYRVGTYSSNWIIKDHAGNSFCDASNLPAAEVQAKLESLDIGAFKGLTPTSTGGIGLLTDGGLCIEFTLHDLNDDIFYVFLPNDLYVGYSSEHGWRQGSSKGPWTGGAPI